MDENTFRASAVNTDRQSSTVRSHTNLKLPVGEDPDEGVENHELIYKLQSEINVLQNYQREKDERHDDQTSRLLDYIAVLQRENYEMKTKQSDISQSQYSRKNHEKSHDATPPK